MIWIIFQSLANIISDYLGLFLVDRIPLVFQQAAAIRQDTGLKVIGLCSANITTYQIHKVRYIAIIFNVLSIWHTYFKKVAGAFKCKCCISAVF